MHQVVGEPLNYHRDVDGDYYDPARLVAWLEVKYARHREEEDLYAAEMIRWFAKLPPTASGLDADARCDETTEGGEAAQRAAGEGWRKVRVNSSFDTLINAIDRAERKGYLPDALAEEWIAFNYEEVEE